MTTVNFAYTGAAQSWTVPAFVYSIDVKLRGAQGGANSGFVHTLGGYVELTIPVLPGDVIQVNCGGAGGVSTGGWNGGGAGGAGFGGGQGGGGATDVRAGGTGATNRVAVAAGGGGNGGNAWSSGGGHGDGTGGGYGGGTTGGAGLSIAGGQVAGVGGDQTPPGSTAAANGTAGTVVSGNQGGGGGGAGGGYNPGQGGSGGIGSNVGGGGGGGGSSYTATTSPRGATSNPVNRGNDSTANGAGSASFTYIVATPTAPTPLAPVASADVDAAAITILRAQFNSPSPASHVVSASFRYKPAGGSFTTVAADTVADPIVAYSVPAATFTADVAVEWQAQTTDNAGNTGPWSPSWFFTPRTVPAAPTVTAPAAAATINNLSTQPITIVATTGQTDTQFRRLGDFGGAPDTGTVYETTAALMAAVLTHHFTDGAAHPSGPEHWQARVRTNSTLWSPWGDVRVDAEIAAPPVPLVVAVQLDGPVVQVQITNPTPTGGQSAADHTDLYRTGPDGAQVRIAAGLGGNAAIIDRGVVGANDYQAIAYSANGASAASA